MVFRGRVTETFRIQSQFYNCLVWGIRVQAGLGDVGLRIQGSAQKQAPYLDCNHVSSD